MTFWDTIERGEYVMFALACLFILALCIWIARGSRLYRDRKHYSSLMQRVRDHVMESDLENALQVCKRAKGSGPGILSAGLENIGQPMSEVNTAMDYASGIEKEKMGKGLRWLKAIAVISPLLGLGGTLTGITDRLRDLGESGTAVDISSVCAALAPTVVTTVAGLGVGIFALVAMTFLEGSVATAQRQADRLCKEFTDMLNEPT